jgi:hypothetical protein
MVEVSNPALRKRLEGLLINTFRPPCNRRYLGKKKTLFKLYPNTIALITRRAAKMGISRSEYVERAVLADTYKT